ncbi:MAG: PIN domain-containing protein [Verrucomicrobia bacterium]|nr:PIN domain-containing protein [Verrucomicrobiota bacterium]
MKVVLDTCILKLATLPNEDNPAALILALATRGRFEWWASPAILDEYGAVLASDPEVLALVQDGAQLCHPLSVLSIIRHEPDNRFVECALAVDADFLITVNTARGHFDRRHYGATRVVTPGEFVNLSTVQRILEQ